MHGSMCHGLAKFTDCCLSVHFFLNFSAAAGQNINRKNELFNKVVDLCEEKEWLFRKDSLPEAQYILQVD